MGCAKKGKLRIYIHGSKRWFSGAESSRCDFDVEHLLPGNLANERDEFECKYCDRNGESS